MEISKVLDLRQWTPPEEKNGYLICLQGLTLIMISKSHSLCFEVKWYFRLAIAANLEHFSGYSSDGGEVSTSWSWLSKKDWLNLFIIYLFHFRYFIWLAIYMILSILYRIAFNGIQRSSFEVSLKFISKKPMQLEQFTSGLLWLLSQLGKIDTIELHPCFLCGPGGNKMVVPVECKLKQ